MGQEWYERHSRTSRIKMYDQIIAGERNVGGFSKQGDKTNPGVIPTGTERESGSFSVFSEVNYNYAGKYMPAVHSERMARPILVRIIAMVRSIRLADRGLFPERNL